MPQKVQQTPSNTFVQGLITEATPLTFPENASIDELNMELSRKGSRRARYGIDFEAGFSYSANTVNADEILVTVTWENVASLSGVDFEVIQAGDTLYFFEKAANNLSDNEKSFSVDLNTFSATNGKVISEHPIEATSLNGFLVVASPAIRTFSIKYDPDTDTITTSAILFLVRDFEWQTDQNSLLEDSATTNRNRTYDAWNSGWPENIIQRYVTRSGNYPRLTHSWYSGKDAFGNFSANDWQKVYSGNSLSGNGKFILNFFIKDRSGVTPPKDIATNDSYLTTSASSSLIAGIPVEREQSRFSTVTTYAGRIWYSGLESDKNGSKVFFSQVIQSEETGDLGKLYQENDPTSEELSDLLDSDGGVINIVGANRIRKLYQYGTTLLVFAENGVWQIGGPDGVFKATEFSVNKVGGTGLSFLRSFVDADGTPFWWDISGIYTMGRNEISQNAEVKNISLTTIQTFWDNISTTGKENVRSAYDQLNKKVYWCYNTDANTPLKLNGILILDIQLGAFYPWLISDTAANSPYIVDIFDVTGDQQNTVTENVIVGSGNIVQVSAVDVVVDVTRTSAASSPKMKFLCYNPSNSRFTIGEIVEGTYQDWGNANATYSSYAETPWNFIGDLTTKKSPIYVTVYLTKEDNASCTLKSYWDGASNNSSSQQVYRPRKGQDTFVSTRNRIRGRGRTMYLRFEGEAGKPFELLGFDTIHARNTQL